LGSIRPGIFAPHIGEIFVSSVQLRRSVRAFDVPVQTQNVDEQFQTTSQDLAGFWDVVMIQVDHVRLMFAEIEQLRQNDWEELSPPEVGSTQPPPISGRNSKRAVP